MLDAGCGSGVVCVLAAERGPRRHRHRRLAGVHRRCARALVQPESFPSATCARQRRARTLRRSWGYRRNGLVLTAAPGSTGPFALSDDETLERLVRDAGLEFEGIRRSTRRGFMAISRRRADARPNYTLLSTPPTRGFVNRARICCRMFSSLPSAEKRRQPRAGRFARTAPETRRAPASSARQERRAFRGR